MFVDTFIRRPILSAVCSLVLALLLGTLVTCPFDDDPPALMVLPTGYLSLLPAPGPQEHPWFEVPLPVTFPFLTRPQLLTRLSAPSE